MRTGSLLTSLLAITLPATNLFADSAATMVYTVGNVTVNGGTISRSAAIFDGDFINTGEGGLTMTRRGSTVVIPGNSQIVLRGNSLELSCGGAMVKTVSGMSTVVQGYRISPVGDEGRYQVIESADQLQVASVEGQLAIFNGKQAIALAAGHSLDLPGRCVTSGALKNASLNLSRTKPNANAVPVPAAALPQPQNQGGGGGGGTAGGAGATGASSVSTVTSIAVSMGAMAVGVGTSLASNSGSPVASPSAP